MRANAHAVFLAAALALAARGADAQQQQLWPADVTEEMFCTAWVKNDYCWARGADDCPAAHCQLETHNYQANSWQSCETKPQDDDVWSQYRTEVYQLTQYTIGVEARQSSLRVADAPNAVQRWDYVQYENCWALNEAACLNTRGCEWAERHYDQTDVRFECGRFHGFEMVAAYEACHSYEFSAFEEGREVFDVIASYRFGYYDEMSGIASMYDSFECQSKCALVGSHRTTCEQTYGCEYDADADACYSPVGSQPCCHSTKPPGAWPTAEAVCPSIRDDLLCSHSWGRLSCEDTDGVCAYGPPPHEPDADCDDAHSPCSCRAASEKTRRTVQEFSNAVWNVVHFGHYDCWSINDKASCVGNCTWRWGHCELSYESSDDALRDDNASDIALAFNRIDRHYLIGDCWSIPDQQTCDSTAGCSSHMYHDETGAIAFGECMSQEENQITEFEEACSGTSADFAPVEEKWNNPGYGGFFSSNFEGYSSGEWPTANEMCPIFRDYMTCDFFNFAEQYGVADARCDPDVCRFSYPYSSASTECDDSSDGFCYCHLASEPRMRTWDDFGAAIWHAIQTSEAEMDCWSRDDENSCASSDACTWHGWCDVSLKVTERALRDAGASTIALAVNRIWFHYDSERCAGSLSECASKDGCVLMSEEFGEWCAPEPDGYFAAAREACEGTGTDSSDAETDAETDESEGPLVRDDDSAANDPLVPAAPLLFAALVFPLAAYA